MQHFWRSPNKDGGSIFALLEEEETLIFLHNWGDPVGKEAPQKKKCSGDPGHAKDDLGKTMVVEDKGGGTGGGGGGQGGQGGALHFQHPKCALFLSEKCPFF